MMTSRMRISWGASTYSKFGHGEVKKRNDEKKLTERRKIYGHEGRARGGEEAVRQAENGWRADTRGWLKKTETGQDTGHRKWGHGNEILMCMRVSCRHHVRCPSPPAMSDRPYYLHNGFYDLLDPSRFWAGPRYEQLDAPVQKKPRGHKGHGLRSHRFRVSTPPISLRLAHPP
jgi:hypothetical protein